MEIKSYAKINLFLLVNRYSSFMGLHKIDTVITRAGNLFDTIIIDRNPKPEPKIRYFTSSGQLIQFDDCIVKRVLDFLSKELKLDINYRIDIYKKIPTEAGLGGGSSNAATVIKYILNDNNIRVTPKLLKSIVKIGSDIPFFLSNFSTARITGYGEKVKEIKLPFNIEIEIANNKISCSTKKVFEAYKLMPRKERLSGNKQLKLLKEKRYEELVNQLQEACFIAYPQVKESANKLNQNISGNKFKLTGSGSSLFRIVQ